MAFRQLDTAEKKALQDQWHMIDTSGDGKLDMAETCEFLDALKHKMSPEQKAAAFKEMDMDGSGSVMVSLQPAHQGGVLTHGWVGLQFYEFFAWYSQQDAATFAKLIMPGVQKAFILNTLAIGGFFFLPAVGIAVGAIGADVRQMIPARPALR